jgi:hypothetical protein
MSTNDRVVEEALSLPANVRIALVEKLLRSLNLPVDEDIDRLWAEEAERRVSQIEGAKPNWSPVKKFSPKFEQSMGDEDPLNRMIYFPYVILSQVVRKGERICHKPSSSI